MKNQFIMPTLSNLFEPMQHFLSSFKNKWQSEAILRQKTHIENTLEAIKLTNAYKTIGIEKNISNKISKLIKSSSITNYPFILESIIEKDLQFYYIEGVAHLIEKIKKSYFNNKDLTAYYDNDNYNIIKYLPIIQALYQKLNTHPQKENLGEILNNLIFEYLFDLNKTNGKLKEYEVIEMIQKNNLSFNLNSFQSHSLFAYGEGVENETAINLIKQVDLTLSSFKDSYNCFDNYTQKFINLLNHSSISDDEKKEQIKKINVYLHEKEKEHLESMISQPTFSENESHQENSVNKIKKRNKI